MSSKKSKELRALEIAGTFVALLLLACAAYGQKIVDERLQSWQKIQPWAIQLFEELDTDHDGLLAARELRSADRGGKLSVVDKEVVHFMRLHQDNIGHITREGQTFETTVWAISLSDLRQSVEPGQWLRWQRCFISEQDFDAILGDCCFSR